MAFILCLVIGLTGCSSSNPEKDTGIISNAESITNFEESNMGHPYELHHIGQKNDSPLAILTQEEHRGKGNDKIWHILTDNFDNPSSKNGWGKIKKKFWKDYAKQVVNGGI